MRLDSALYALSRLFLPTLEILTLTLVWTLSPTETWNFIKSNTGSAVFVRMLILFSEVGLFVYLYYTHYYNNPTENEKQFDLNYSGNYDKLGEFIYTRTRSASDKVLAVSKLSNVLDTERYLVCVMKK